jgi:hypothetical protein
MTHQRFRGLACCVSLALLSCRKSSKPVAPLVKESAPEPAISIARDAGPALVDLLYAVPAVVAVSSRVDNARDLPEHLVDQKSETAWNGQSGDLVGGWIGVRLPGDAWVSHVLIHAGFDHKNATEDLFTANVRIRTLRITQKGFPTREVVLDPALRGPQRIEIAAMGGDLKLEVRDVLEGTKKAWRELVVSELQVLGVPGKTVHAKPRQPIVRVGSFDPWSPLEAAPSFATLEAACTAFEKRGNDAWDQAKREGIHAWDNVEREMSCDPNGPELSAAKGSTARSVLVTSSTPINYTADFGGDLLAVRTHNASYLTSIKVNGTERTMFETATYRLLDARWFTPKQGAILAVQVAHQFDQTLEGGDPNLEHHSSHTEHRGILCEVTKGKLLCKTIVTATKGPAENVRAVSVHEQASGEVVFDTR